MKKIALVTLFSVYICGCTMDTKVITYNPPNEEMAGYYDEWQKIDPANLTPGQQSLLDQLDPQVWMADAFARDFVALFPWIDQGNLTVRDMVFLGQKIKEYGPDIVMALLG